MQFPVLIRTNFDEERQKWLATSPDLDGFEVSADSIESLKKQLPQALSQAIKLTETIGADGSIEIDGQVRLSKDKKRTPQGTAEPQKGQRAIPYQIMLGTQRHAPLNVRVKRNIRLIGDNHAIETDIGAKPDASAARESVNVTRQSEREVSKDVKQPEESAPQTGSPRKWTQVFFSS